jgi:hypothetical protein
MANVFDQILNISGVEATKKANASVEWFRQKASNQRISPESVLGGKEYKNNLMRGIKPGSMYLFKYDAKTKDTLPYWDMYPLIFPISMDSKGFIGINLHYLPPNLRASLFNNLMRFKSNTPSKELAINYSILTKYSSLSYFKPCVKRYLYGHVRSQFMYIAPEEWPIAIFLPLQRFQKSGSGKVYADSRKAVGQDRKYK